MREAHLRCFPTVVHLDQHFTGKERDSESGNDYFGARYYASSMGRFLSPDPVIVTPDRLKDPQQLNLYAYVRNNPLSLIDPTGEILECTGDNKADCFSTLQQLAGDYANRLSMDAKTGVVSFDTTGLDLKGNEGATLVNQLVGSSNTYGFAVGATIDTAGGPVKVATVENIPAGADQPQQYKPVAGITDQVVVNPNAGLYDSNGKLVTTESLAFHELAEAYAKVDEGKPYSDFNQLNVLNWTIEIGNMQVGAHHEAVIREFNLRDQQPSLKTTGRAGDMLHPEPQQIIRNPH
jgi:RHS repeat-associated protein